MAQLQLAELTAFVAVAEQLSFTKAAVKVGIALPTMSQAIRSLEERLGGRLVNRTTRSGGLTGAGAPLPAAIPPVLEGLAHAPESRQLVPRKPIRAVRL